MKIVTLIVTILILTSLGLWQLDRAKQKKQLIYDFSQRHKAAPLNNITELLTKDIDEIKFMPVILQGSFVNHRTLLLDNQVKNKKPGYRIITPFQVNTKNNKIWILIDRGWIAANNKRANLPNVPSINGIIKLHGFVNQIKPGLVLVRDKIKQNPSYPLLIQAIDYEFIAKQFNHSVAFLIVQLFPEKPNLTVTSEKHFGYALQWFIIAMLVLFYGIYWIKK